MFRKKLSTVIRTEKRSQNSSLSARSVARKRLERMPMNYDPKLDTALVKEMQKHFKRLKKRYDRS